MATLNFGLWDAVSGHEMSLEPAADVYARHIRIAKEIERLGYHSYWVIEHQNSPVGQITSPSVFLSTIAAQTTTLRFGAMIWSLPFNNPMRLAQEVAMLDHLSRGRVEFGSGIGVLEHEFIRWGLDFYERAAMSGEAMDIIRMAWTQDEVTYKGKYWTFEEALPAPKPYQQPHPPIWIGAHGKASLEYAARNNWHLSQNLDTDDRIAQNLDYFWKIWQECGHTEPKPEVFLMRLIHVAETDDQAREEAEQHILSARAAQGAQGPLARTRVGRGSDPTGFGTDRATEANVELLRVFSASANSYDFNIENGLAIVGSPSTVIRKIQEGRERLGYTLLAGNHAIGRMPAPLVEKSIRLFGQEVIPAFR